MSQLAQMYLVIRFGGRKSYKNGDIDMLVSSYMNISEKAELIL